LHKVPPCKLQRFEMMMPTVVGKSELHQKKYNAENMPKQGLEGIDINFITHTNYLYNCW